MTPDWQDYLAANGARFDNGQIVDFGDPGRELSAAREATVLCPLTHLAAFECTGNDAQTFLHNQLTSDVNHLGADAAQYAAWCSPKGRMLVSFILSRNANGYLGLISADLLAFTLKRLQMYVLRSKVSIVDRSAEFNSLGVSGPQAEVALQRAGLPVPTGPMSTASSATTKVIRLDELRFVIIADSATAAVWESLSKSAVPAGAPAWCWLDIQAGIPIIAEATKEAFVPQMVNYDKIGGVSFHKGCYPGQEVVARTQYLGKVKRHLYRFHAECGVAAGAAVYPVAGSTEQQPCGIIASVAPSPDGGHDGLAVILEGTIDNGELTADDRNSGRCTLFNVALVETAD